LGWGVGSLRVCETDACVYATVVVDFSSGVSSAAFVEVTAGSLAVFSEGLDFCDEIDFWGAAD